MGSGRIIGAFSQFWATLEALRVSLYSIKVSTRPEAAGRDEIRQQEIIRT